MLRSIRRALLSVTDKSGLVEFAKVLHNQHGVELIATGGTHKLLAESGLPVKDIAELTKFPEMLDGRVKTLHPMVYGGILADRNKPTHLVALVEHHLPEIDLVVCNLYPFEKTVAKPDVTMQMAVENIDIGGPCMIRAAAKNHASVAVAIDPAQYESILSELKLNNGQTTLELRRSLAGAAFGRIAEYDIAIRNYFNATSTFTPSFERLQTLRYGENPHQEASFYREIPAPTHACVATATQLHGKELSYNNILDLDAALNIVREFEVPAAVVIKHNNPCGAAVAGSLARAFTLAWDGDPLSAFGGILAFNRTVDAATAKALMTGERFVECVIAPDYEPSALDTLKGWKKNVRLLKCGTLEGPPRGMDYRRVDGGLLVQGRDVGADAIASWKNVTTKQPDRETLGTLWFAWLICKHVKSNAIVLARGAGAGEYQLVGTGAGQMSRVDSTQIAIRKAGEKSKGSVLASDAFFPFPDNVDHAAAAGVVAIVQPGGSVKDPESIAACDNYGLTMCFTGVRHFKH